MICYESKKKRAQYCSSNRADIINKAHCAHFRYLIDLSNITCQYTFPTKSSRSLLLVLHHYDVVSDFISAQSLSPWNVFLLESFFLSLEVSFNFSIPLSSFPCPSSSRVPVKKWWSTLQWLTMALTSLPPPGPQRMCGWIDWIDSVPICSQEV